jgi:predicted ribosomally synthesized peptide with nif11-like leader
VSREGLAALRAHVDGDPELALRLRRVDPERFAADVLRLASENGYEVTEADIAAATTSAQRAWTLRWVR